MNLSVNILAVSEATPQRVPMTDDAPAVRIAVIRPSGSSPMETSWVAELHAMSMKSGPSIRKLKNSFIVKGAVHSVNKEEAKLYMEVRMHTCNPMAVRETKTLFCDVVLNEIAVAVKVHHMRGADYILECLRGNLIAT
jgi:hypothetical protein